MIQFYPYTTQSGRRSAERLGMDPFHDEGKMIICPTVTCRDPARLESNIFNLLKIGIQT